MNAAVVRVSYAMIGQWLQGGDFSRLDSIDSSLPSDARVVFVEGDYRSQCLVVGLESPSFDPVPEGQAAPEIEVRFTAHYREPQ